MGSEFQELTFFYKKILNITKTAIFNAMNLNYFGN